jgi:hypothetical protein
MRRALVLAMAMVVAAPFVGGWPAVVQGSGVFLMVVGAIAACLELRAAGER